MVRRPIVSAAVGGDGTAAEASTDDVIFGEPGDLNLLGSRLARGAEPADPRALPRRKSPVRTWCTFQSQRPGCSTQPGLSFSAPRRSCTPAAHAIRGALVSAQAARDRHVQIGLTLGCRSNGACRSSLAEVPVSVDRRPRISRGRGCVGRAGAGSPALSSNVAVACRDVVEPHRGGCLRAASACRNPDARSV